MDAPVLVALLQHSVYSCPFCLELVCTSISNSVVVAGDGDLDRRGVTPTQAYQPTLRLVQPASMLGFHVLKSDREMPAKPRMPSRLDLPVPAQPLRYRTRAVYGSAPRAPRRAVGRRPSARRPSSWSTSAA